MPPNMWDEITHPNVNGYTAEVLEWLNNFIPHFIMMDVII